MIKWKGKAWKYQPCTFPFTKIAELLRRRYFVTSCEILNCWEKLYWHSCKFADDSGLWQICLSLWTVFLGSCKMYFSGETSSHLLMIDWKRELVPNWQYRSLSDIFDGFGSSPNNTNTPQPASLLSWYLLSWYLLYGFGWGQNNTNTPQPASFLWYLLSWYLLSWYLLFLDIYFFDICFFLISTFCWYLTDLDRVETIKTHVIWSTAPQISVFAFLIICYF